jgi:hypothetical protein
VGDAGGPVLVKSSMQKLVSTSSTEAEMIALVAAVQRVLPLRDLLLELGIEFDCCVKIYEDNQSCIAIAEAGAGTSGQRKLFRVKYFFIKELIQGHVIRIVHCPSTEMIADLCTKSQRQDRNFGGKGPHPRKIEGVLNYTAIMYDEYFWTRVGGQYTVRSHLIRLSRLSLSLDSR